MTPRLRKTDLPQPQVFRLIGISECNIRQIEQAPEDTIADEMGFRKSSRPNTPSLVSQVKVAARLCQRL